ncbi:MAG: hypothetical protein EOP50_05945, partial [Sphingobacteriales bacterium]
MSEQQPFRQLSFAQQALLKITDKRAFKIYRQDLMRHRLEQKILARPKVQIDFSGKTELSFRHSGNIGDVIYSLPCVEALAGGRPAHY